MTAHPRPMPQPTEVPGLAYYTPAFAAPAPKSAPKVAISTAQTRAAEALAAHYGYYNAAD